MPGMKKTMSEFGKGQLHSGSKKGPKVTNRKQAIAIGLNQQRKAQGQPQPQDPASAPSFQGLQR